MDHRRGLDLVDQVLLLWLWCRLATAALIQPLDWELPYAAGAAIKKEKEREREKGRKKEKNKQRKEGRKTVDSITFGWI